MKTIRIAVICLLFTFGLALLPVVAPTHAQSAPTVVNIQNFAFSPATVTVPAGTTIVFSNLDSVDHAPVSDTGAWDAGDVPGGTRSIGIAFNTPGTYPYHCAIHPDMVGTVIVTGAAPGATSTATLPAPPTAVPTSVPTLPPGPTSAPTSVPATSTPVPTATSTPAPLFVKLAIGHKTTKAGAKQSIKVTTVPGAAVSITLTYPDGKKSRKSAHATAGGTYTWNFKQPSGHTTRTKHTAKVAVTVTSASGSAKASKSYTIQ